MDNEIPTKKEHAPYISIRSTIPTVDRIKSFKTHKNISHEEVINEALDALIKVRKSNELKKMRELKEQIKVEIKEENQE